MHKCAENIFSVFCVFVLHSLTHICISADQYASKNTTHWC